MYIVNIARSNIALALALTTVASAQLNANNSMSEPFVATNSMAKFTDYQFTADNITRCKQFARTELKRDLVLRGHALPAFVINSTMKTLKWVEVEGSNGTEYHLSKRAQNPPTAAGVSAYDKSLILKAQTSTQMMNLYIHVACSKIEKDNCPKKTQLDRQFNLIQSEYAKLGFFITLAGVDYIWDDHIYTGSAQMADGETLTKMMRAYMTKKHRGTIGDLNLYIKDLDSK